MRYCYFLRLKKKKKSPSLGQKAQGQAEVSSFTQVVTEDLFCAERGWGHNKENRHQGGAVGDPGPEAGHQGRAGTGALTGDPGSPQTGPARVGRCGR